MASTDSTPSFEPLWRRWPADLDTPLSTWLKVGHGRPYGVLLESVEGGEQVGRWSFVASDPLWVLTVRGASAWIDHRDGRRENLEGFFCLPPLLAGADQGIVDDCAWYHALLLHCKECLQGSIWPPPLFTGADHGAESDCTSNYHVLLHRHENFHGFL